MTVTIAAIEPIALRIPYDRWAPASLFAGKPHVTMDAVYVKVTASNGVVGWGETFFGGREMNIAALDRYVAPLALGKSVDDPALLLRIEFLLQNLGRSGPVHFALSGLDIALWDIRGKIAGQPIHALLGGKKRDRVRVYASLLAYQNDLDHVRRNVTRALERGFVEVKMHEKTPEAVAAAREAAGPDIPIMVDVNCAWTPQTAREPILGMKPHNPMWVEEPVWPPEDFATAASLRRETGVPIAMGENAANPLDFAKMVEAGAADFVQPSVTKIGGVTQLWVIAQAAEAAGAHCVPHAPYFGPGSIATLQVLAAKQRESSLERFFCEMAFTPFSSTLPVVDGHIAVPDGPGLGADPEPELLEKYRLR
jgi:L-alanine-DL-glutamate epimerase-like enolase superfamily enzyme